MSSDTVNSEIIEENYWKLLHASSLFLAMLEVTRELRPSHRKEIELLRETESYLFSQIDEGHRIQLIQDGRYPEMNS